jgi:hypothetical protein
MADKYYEIRLESDVLGILNNLYIKFSKKGIKVIHGKRIDVNTPTNSIQEAHFEELGLYKGFIRKIKANEFKDLEKRVKARN